MVVVRQPEVGGGAAAEESSVISGQQAEAAKPPAPPAEARSHQEVKFKVRSCLRRPLDLDLSAPVMLSTFSFMPAHAG